MEVGSSSLPGTTSHGILCDPFNRGGLAQLARAPALQAGGQRFESVILHTRYDLALFMVGGSIIESIFDILTQAKL